MYISNVLYPLIDLFVFSILSVVHTANSDIGCVGPGLFAVLPELKVKNGWI